jgi:hypothetical protein
VEFPDISKEKTQEFFDVGRDIFLTVFKKYPRKNIHDLDAITNALCAALFLLGINSIEEKNIDDFCGLINKIIRRWLIHHDWKRSKGE